MNMSTKLIIVESPTKAKTISKFVGSGYKVESSFGHVRDLPKSKLGIDVENNFEPQYVIPRKIQPRVTALKKIAAKADEVILATDEDREGEAIAWHLVTALKLKNDSDKPIKRIVFHEITKTAIKNALDNPRTIFQNLVNAQQARRVLDRLVGYQLSPFLWKKVVRGLSAGRVQSAAMRLIAAREEEINKFKSYEYWTIEAKLETEKREILEASLSKIGDESVPKLGIGTETEAQKILSDLKDANYKIENIERNETKKNPYPPFITSTLQQTASRHFGFSAKRTMMIAQSLYEGGHITYMRTDSVNLSKEALVASTEWIKAHLPEEYQIPPKNYENKSRLAQEAHEAIRPTDPNLAPEEWDDSRKSKLDKDQEKLYSLIWRRFIASQLPHAKLDATKIEVRATAGKNNYILAANGNILRFDGFLKIWPIKMEEKILPELTKDDPVSLIEVTPTQHFTEPPPRYNEASLIKTLEKYGIGRPSTYAPIISVIQNRNYVEKIQGRLQPTEIGLLVDKVLKENFPEIVDLDFTAKMENELDEIAEDKKQWQEVIREFYEPFSVHLKQKYEEVSKKEIAEEKTDQKCELCGKDMIIKFGRFGKFMACSGFPECKNTKNLKDPPKPIGLKCPKCGEGDVIERRVSRKGRARGKIFWGCNRYPDCDYASWTNPLNPEEKKPLEIEALEPKTTATIEEDSE
jgi:DNA topoisomerase-1